MKTKLLALAAVSAALVLAPSAAQGVTGGPRTTEPDEYLIINVTITDTKIKVSDRTAQRGNGVDFHVRNLGRLPHNFVFQGAGAIGLSDLGLQTPVLKPRQSRVLQLYMDYRGTFVLHSTVKKDVNKPGMKVNFTVT